MDSSLLVEKVVPCLCDLEGFLWELAGMISPSESDVDREEDEDEDSESDG